MAAEKLALLKKLTPHKGFVGEDHAEPLNSIGPAIAPETQLSALT